MLKKFRKIIAAASVCVLITGIAVYAQNAPAQRPAGKHRTAAAGRTAVQQNTQQQSAQQQGDAASIQNRDRMQQRARARMGSLTGLLTPPNPDMVQRLSERLGLNDQQKQQIKQVYSNFENTVKPIRQQRVEALKAFMTAFKNPGVSKAELQKLSEPILAADRAILDAEYDFWLAFRPILNTQQQQKLHSFMMQQAGQEFGEQGFAPAPREKGNHAAPAK